MRDITTTVYQYAELNEEARERARDWYRQISSDDMFWSESPTEDFLELLKACGWDVDSKRGLQWSGFSSQGDGAAFKGSWHADLCKPDAWLADRPAAFTDSDGKGQTCEHNKRYHEAVAEIVALAAAHPGSWGAVDHGRSNFIQVDSFNVEEFEDDEPADLNALAYELAEAARSLAQAFYWNLEAEWEYQNSDDVVADTIACNEYEFTPDGRRHR